MQGKTEVSISDLAEACGLDGFSAIYRHPDVASVREVEVIDAAGTESKSKADAANPKLQIGGSAFLL